MGIREKGERRREKGSKGKRGKEKGTLLILLHGPRKEAQLISIH